MDWNAGITVGELIEQLRRFDEKDELFMGGLSFYRLKKRDDKLVQIEFNESVYFDESGTIVVEQND